MFSRGPLPTREITSLSAEHRTHTRNRGGLADACQIGQFNLTYRKPIGHDLQETARPRSAFIVHQELLHHSPSDSQITFVSWPPTSITAPSGPNRLAAPFSVARDFSYHLVGIKGNSVATVSCGNHGMILGKQAPLLRDAPSGIGCLNTAENQSGSSTSQRQRRPRSSTTAIPSLPSSRCRFPIPSMISFLLK